MERKVFQRFLLRAAMVAFLIVIAIVVRLGPLQGLGTRLAYVTFYPAVMIAALYGGIFTGLSATALSAVTVYFWHPQGQLFIQDATDWVGMAVFGFNGVMIATICEAMYRARARARRETDVARKEADRAQRSAEHAEQSLRELRLTQDELIRTEKLSALGLMVAGVAHEINTPLGAALVAVSKLQEAGSNLEQHFTEGLRRSDLEAYLRQQGEGLGLAVHSLERASRLVKSFKQLAADRANEDQRTFSLETVVNECLILVETVAKRFHIELNVNVAPDIVMHGYPGSLSQVIFNLVNNAITHAFDGRNGGKIDITAQIDAASGFLRLDIADNGNGMSAETLGRVFDPFFTTRRGRGGMGLGLHICHQTTTRVLGGSLDVESAIGLGTRFSLRIPVQAPAGVVVT